MAGNGFRRLVGDAARLGFAAQDAIRNAVRLTSDAFNEADHPRAGGKFTAGSNATPSTKTEHSAQAAWHRAQAKVQLKRRDPLNVSAAAEHHRAAKHHEKMSGQAGSNKRLLAGRMAAVR